MKRARVKQVFEPDIEIMMKTAFIIVDENRSRNVHCVYKYQSLFDAAFSQALLYLRRDIDEGPAARDIEPPLFGIVFHIAVSHTVTTVQTCVGGVSFSQCQLPMLFCDYEILNFVVCSIGDNLL